MANFCTKCGSPIDANTGLCPNCNPSAEVYKKTDIFDSAFEAEPEVNSQVSDNSEDTRTKELKKAISPKNKVLKVFLTVILSVLLFITLSSSFIICDVRSALTRRNIENILDDTDVFAAMDSLDINIENYLGKLKRFMEHKLDIKISERNIENFVEDSTLKDFAADKAAIFFEDFFSDGEAELEITEEEVRTLLYENLNIIEEETGEIFLNEDVALMAEWITDGKTQTIFTSEMLKNEEPDIYYTLYFGFSYVALVILLLMSGLFIFLLFKNNLSYGLCGTGISFILCGIPVTLIWLLTAWLPGALSVLFNDPFIGVTIGKIISLNGILGIVIMAIGILCLVAKKLIVRKYVK